MQANQTAQSGDGTSGQQQQQQQQAGAASSVGRGTVYDPSAFGQTNTDGSIRLEIPNDPTRPVPSRSHYFLSRSEIMKGAANRFVHSTAYLYLYAGMSLASFATVILSLTQDCPGVLFYSLELVVNIVLIAEVSMRCFAFGRQFWKSTFNIIDLCLVLLCAITLAVIFFNHECSALRGPSHDDDEEDTREHRSGRGEELLDSFLLVVRNVAQCVRLLSVIRRSSSNVAGRVPAIDLNAASGYNLDLDLEDEGSRARERMALGGDRSAQDRFIAVGGKSQGKRGPGTPEERAALFDYDEDDDL